jgi:hypothetical protein
VPAAPVKANGGISGKWTITMSIAGNMFDSKCALAQDGPKLGGTCAALGGDEAPVTGAVTGAKVTFAYSANLGGNAVDLAYSGGLDAAGAKMTGSFTVGGMDGEFTGMKE